MYKKYKIKRKNKLNKYLIFAILAIGLIFMSCGYALWSDSLKITGKANIKAEQQSKYPEMFVEILESLISVIPPPSGFKLVSNSVDGNSITSTVEIIDTSSYSQSGIFSFYYTNKSGYDASNGTTEISVTGNSEAIGTISPTITTSIANGGTGVFHTYIPINASAITIETKIDISIKYTVNGEAQAFHYYVIVKPKA